MIPFPGWYYDELKQIGTDFENPAQVAAFDRNQKSSSIEAEQALIKRLGISQGHTVIDIGCGTGTFAISSALVGASVHAVDVSQVMLTYARQKAQSLNVVNIKFHHTGFLTYEHQADAVDFIVTKSALHHLPDFWKMVALLRIASMLKDDGIFYLRDVIYSFNPAEYQSHINTWIEKVAKPAGEGFTKQDFETHVREEYTTFGWIIEGMLKQAGFEIEVADYFSPTSAQYVCRKT